MSAMDILKEQSQLCQQREIINNTLAENNLKLVDYFNERLENIKSIIKTSPELHKGYENVLDLHLIERIDCHWNKPLTKEEVLKLSVSYVSYNLATLKVYLNTGDPFCGATWTFKLSDNIDEFLSSVKVRERLYTESTAQKEIKTINELCS